VEQALLATSLDEPTALAAATRLYEMGVLVPVPRAVRPTDPMMDGLPEDARRQLEAFRIRTVQEVKRPQLKLVSEPPAPAPVAKPAAATPTVRGTDLTPAVKLPGALPTGSAKSPAPKARTITPTALAHPGEPFAMPVAISAALTDEDHAALAKALRPSWQQVVTVMLLGAALIGATSALLLRKPKAPVPTATALTATATESLARDAYRQGDLAKARALVAQLIAVRPLDAGAWTLLAQLRFDQGDRAGAREAVEKALALRPGEEEALTLAQKLGPSAEGAAAALR
jgi:hypothetical protein